MRCLSLFGSRALRGLARCFVAGHGWAFVWVVTCGAGDAVVQTIGPLPDAPVGAATAPAVFGVEPSRRIAAELRRQGGLTEVQLVYAPMEPEAQQRRIRITDSKRLEEFRMGLVLSRCSIFPTDLVASPGGGALAQVRVVLGTESFWFGVNEVGFHITPAPHLGTCFTSRRLAEAINATLLANGLEGLSALQMESLSGPP